MPNKISQTSAKMHPWAQCQTDGCDWEHVESSRTRDAAKSHARDNLHSVLVVIEDRALYTGQPS